MKVLRADCSIEKDGLRLVARGRRDLTLDFEPEEAIRAGERLAELGRHALEHGLVDLTPTPTPPPHKADARGWKVPPQSQPGYGKGRRNPAKGRKFPPDPPTAMEIVALMGGCPETPAGRRLRALIALLWRSGLRIHEALLLSESDLDHEAGSIVVRRGKGGKRRVSGMDQFGWAQVIPWLEERRAYPLGPVFCVVRGPTAGIRAVSQGDVRTELKKIAAEQGIRKRMTCHQFRHAHAVELVREGARVDLLSKQLGHSNLAVTTTYLQGVTADELLDLANTRSAPMMAAPDVIGLLNRGPAPEPKKQPPLKVVNEAMAA